MSEALARDLQVTLKAPTCSSAEPGACRQAVQEAVIGWEILLCSLEEEDAGSEAEPATGCKLSRRFAGLLCCERQTIGFGCASLPHDIHTLQLSDLKPLKGKQQ